MKSPENQSLKLLDPVPESQLQNWLKEFYGHSININRREILRHRDLSYVERLHISDGLPSSIIYKLVLPPWDIEKDILEHILIPSVCNSPQLYLAAHSGSLTVLFMEDLGTESLLNVQNTQIANRLGKDLAKLHRSYIYRIDELMQTQLLRSITPINYSQMAETLIGHLKIWDLIKTKDESTLRERAHTFASKLAREPISLVHGDFYAENVLTHNNKLYIIDWSWFTFIGVPLLDLATITSKHLKNGNLGELSNEIIEAYCEESGREIMDINNLLPYAEKLSRLLFLQWLVERKSRGIEGTTVGPVDKLICDVVQEVLN